MSTLQNDQSPAHDTERGDQDYHEVISAIRMRGGERLGYMTSWAWIDDPKRLAFTLARYKFVAKMLAGTGIVIEIGCGDGFGSRIVKQSVGTLIGLDFNSEFIVSAKACASAEHSVDFHVHDMMRAPFDATADACYCMDVLEHIVSSDESLFLANIVKSLRPDGICIVGTPSLESQHFASKYSKSGHVNCKTQTDLRKTMKRHFRNVFMFSMNDEVVHTGYEKMSHYNIALCCGPY